MEYIEYTILLLLNIVANLLPPEYFWWFFVAKWGLKMKKIFIAIVACMICNTAIAISGGDVGGETGGFFNGCQPGFYCVNCAGIAGGSGSTTSSGQPYCVPCPNGTYQSAFSYKGKSCTTCPSGFTTYGTGASNYDSIDDCKIWCTPGTYLPANDNVCIQCPRNSYCTGGFFPQANINTGITQCKDGLYSPPGSDSADDCGRILHIGEYVLYLRTAKLTSPALHVKIGDVIYYGDMFPA